MPGPIRTFSNTFLVETLSTDQNIDREVFSSINSYFERHPGFTRIASNFGTSGTGLSGSFAYVSRSGENAWSIYRTLSSSVPYDISFVWSQAVNYTPNTWTNLSTFGLGMSLAHHVSGAWSGSVGNVGTDTFTLASNPWRSGSFVMPRANAQFGATAINKNSVMKLISSVIANQIYQVFIVGDNETTYFWLQNGSQTQVGDTICFAAFGTYTPITSSFNLPLFGFSASSLESNVIIGSLTASNIGFTGNSGGASYTTNSDFRSFILNYPNFAPRQAPRVSPDLSSIANTRALAFPISISTFDSGHFQNVGFLSGVYAVAGNAFGNIQDVSRSFVSFKIRNTPSQLSFLLPFSGSTDFFLKGTYG